jgi:hypothetical protein
MNTPALVFSPPTLCVCLILRPVLQSLLLDPSEQLDLIGRRPPLNVAAPTPRRQSRPRVLQAISRRLAEAGAGSRLLPPVSAFHVDEFE